MSHLQNRYEIGHHLEGLIETASSFSTACDLAEAWESKETGYARGEVRIFDSMARQGRPERWGLVQGQWIPLRWKERRQS